MADIKCIVFALTAFRKTGYSTLCSKSRELRSASRQQFVNIALMTNVKNKPVL